MGDNAKNMIRENNFDFIRLILASMVVVNHCYLLTGRDDLLNKLTNGQANLGSLAVESFFVVSGYLIFISLKNSKSIVSYLWKKIVRIFPGLIALLIVSLILMPFFYNGKNIFKETTYWSYFLNNLSLYNIQYNVDYVFNNQTVNISLWTLSYEFTLYLSIALLFYIRKKKYVYIILLIGFIFSYYFSLFHPNLFSKYFRTLNLNSQDIYRLSAYFIAGSLITYLKLQSRFFSLLIIPLSVIIMLSAYVNMYNIITPVTLPLLILIIGTSNCSSLKWLTRNGDISYGVYIYGFFLQQIIHNTLNLNIWMFCALSLLATFVFAYASWKYIESPSLKFKHIL